MFAKLQYSPTLEGRTVHLRGLDPQQDGSMSICIDESEGHLFVDQQILLLSAERWQNLLKQKGSILEIEVEQVSPRRFSGRVRMVGEGNDWV